MTAIIPDCQTAQARRNPAARGTEVLDAEAGTPKSARENVMVTRDRKGRMKWAEIPTEMACFMPAWKSAVCQDWMVGLVWTELPTTHAVIERVSDTVPGTELFDAETDG